MYNKSIFKKSPKEVEQVIGIRILQDQLSSEIQNVKAKIKEAGTMGVSSDFLQKFDIQGIHEIQKHQKGISLLDDISKKMCEELWIKEFNYRVGDEALYSDKYNDGIKVHLRTLKVELHEIRTPSSLLDCRYVFWIITIWTKAKKNGEPGKRTIVIDDWENLSSTISENKDNRSGWVFNHK